MKRLILMRHGKAESEALYDSDFERRLADSGVREATVVAARLAQAKLLPARILASPAPRALSTACLVRDALGGERVELRQVPELYLAVPATLREVLARHAVDCDDVMLVGHNPGLSEFARQLAPVRLDELPTAGVIAFEFDGDDCGAPGTHAGRVLYFDYPLRVSS